MAKPLPLNDWHRSRGAEFREEEGWLLPRSFSKHDLEYEAVRQHAGLFDLSHRSLIRFTGADRISFLQGMVSNDVQSAGIGDGLYATVLDVHGKILADLRIFLQTDQILVDCWGFLKEKLLAHLHRYLIADEVEIMDLSEQFGTISLQGPGSRQILQSTIPNIQLPSKNLSHTSVSFGEIDVWLIRATHTGEEGFDLLFPLNNLEPFLSRLEEIEKTFALSWVGTEVQEVVRLEAGIPRYPIDMDEGTLLLETGLENAVSFEKGCYLGQEVIERIRSRGHINRKLLGIRLQGDQPASRGNPIFYEEKEVGMVTSSVFSPAMNAPVALGYIRKEYAQPGTQLAIHQIGGVIEAAVSPLPFYSIPDALAHSG